MTEVLMTNLVTNFRDLQSLILLVFQFLFEEQPNLHLNSSPHFSLEVFKVG